jgi:type VI secretion system secreted protein Hcp
MKEWGAATPQIFMAMVNNEVLKSVLFEFYKTNANGEEYIYHTIKLEKATVMRVEYSTGLGASETTAKHGAQYDTHEIEIVSLSYDKIIHENIDGKTTADDQWTK